MGSSESAVHANYIIPAVPFLMIIAARLICNFCFKVTRNANYRYSLCAVLAVVFIFLPGYYSIKHDYLLTKGDTRIVAKDWFEENVPYGTRIAMLRCTALPGFLPPISEIPEENEEKLRAIIKENPGKGKTRGARAELGVFPEQCYEIIDIDPMNRTVKKYETDYKFSALIRKNVKYIITTSFTEQALQYNKEFTSFKKELEERTELVKVFTPFKEGVKPFNLYRSAHTPFDNLDKLKLSGPVVKIYKLPKIH